MRDRDVSLEIIQLIACRCALATRNVIGCRARQRRSGLWEYSGAASGEQTITIRYDTRYYFIFNVRSKADVSQLSLSR